jgi:hypothetical protein
VVTISRKRRHDTPDIVMVTLAMKANISTEVVVETSVGDKMFTLQTVIGLGKAMVPPVETSAALFDLLVLHNVQTYFHTLVRASLQ